MNLYIPKWILETALIGFLVWLLILPVILLGNTDTPSTACLPPTPSPTQDSITL